MTHFGLKQPYTAGSSYQPSKGGFNGPKWSTYLVLSFGIRLGPFGPSSTILDKNWVFVPETQRAAQVRCFAAKNHSKSKDLNVLNWGLWFLAGTLDRQLREKESIWSSWWKDPACPRRPTSFHQIHFSTSLMTALMTIHNFKISIRQHRRNTNVFCL